MNTPNRARSLEQQAAHYQGDGLFDLVLGAALLLIGMLLVMGGELIPWAAIIPPLVMALMPMLKRSITVPRISEIEIAEVTQQRIQRVKLTVFGSVILLFLLTIGGFILLDWMAIQLPDWIWSGIMIGVGGVLLAILALLSWATHTRRYAAYVLLASAAGMAGVALGIALEWLLLAVGGMIVAGGLVTLARFLSGHPGMRHPTAV